MCAGTHLPVLASAIVHLGCWAVGNTKSHPWSQGSCILNLAPQRGALRFISQGSVVCRGSGVGTREDGIDRPIVPTDFRVTT